MSECSCGRNSVESDPGRKHGVCFLAGDRGAILTMLALEERRDKGGVSGRASHTRTSTENQGHTLQREQMLSETLHRRQSVCHFTQTEV